jgi:hypothetical protein
MYDQEKDKKLKEIGDIFNTDSLQDATIRISVEIYQYGKGNSKVSIQRWYRRGEDWKAAKLGRLTPKEAVELQKLLSEAVEFIDTQI